MLEQHIALGAGITVAGIRVPIESAGEFGVIEADGDARTIRAFHEKPENPLGMEESPGEVLASMGNYIFSADVLIDAVTRDAADESSAHDLGGNIIPQLVERGQACVWDFANSRIAGAGERDLAYWRDVGTLDAYYDAHMDLISVDPMFNLYNEDWPIRTWPEQIRRRSSSSRRTLASVSRRTRWSAPASSSRAEPCAGRSSRPASTCTRTPSSRAPS